MYATVSKASLASDGFFPFRDNIDIASRYGVKNIIQPGGSNADEIIIKTCDEYDINMILLPGLNQNQHSAIITQAIDVAEERGDCFVIVDPTPHDSNITTATAPMGFEHTILILYMIMY